MGDIKYADICGNLEKTIIMPESPHIRKCGIVFINIDQKRAADSGFWRGIYKSNSIPVFLWGQEVLDKLAHISDDEKIWAVGKLELLDKSLLTEVGYYIDPNDLEESGNVVISVRDKNRIRTISKDEAHDTWLSIS
jgi:hypothetical protein